MGQKLDPRTASKNDTPQHLPGHLHTPLRAGLALLILALPFALAGCIGGAGATSPLDAAHDVPDVDPMQPLAVDDPIGDAYDNDWDVLAIDPDCNVACRPVGAQPGSAAGTKAPWLDISAARAVEEHDGMLHFELDIADLDGAFAELDALPGLNRLAIYEVCWNAGPSTDERCVRTHVARMAGEAHLTGNYELWAEGCGGWGVCSWSIKTWLDPGAPATMHWHVPKAYVLHDATEPVITGLYGRTEWYAYVKDAPITHHAVTAAAAGQHTHFHSSAVPGMVDYDTDLTEHAGGQARFDARDAVWPDTSAGISTAPPGNAWGDGGIRDIPETDILGVRFSADGDDVVLSFTMANVEAEPSRLYHIESLVSMTDEAVFEIGVRQDSHSDMYGFVGQCIGLECDGPWQERVPVEVTPGKGGSYTIRFPSSLLGDHLEGRLVNNVASFAMTADWSIVTDKPGTDPMIEDHGMNIVDAHWGATPFAWGTPEDLPDGDLHHHEH